MTLEVQEYIQSHPSGRVKIAFPDIDGVLRGKYISAEKFLYGAEKEMGFCNVIHGWDSSDAAYDNAKYTGWHTGYPDAPVRIDLSTFRKIPWENGMPFFLGGSAPGDGDHVCSRTLLSKMLQRSLDMGFTPVFSQEFEWFNYRETPQTLADKGLRDLTPLSGGMFGYSVLRPALYQEFFADLFEQLRAFGVPLEGLHTETGPGVLEAAIEHSGILEAADRAILFKSAVKEISYRHGIAATFMAKVDEKLPGCGGHVHQSLWKDDQNFFHHHDSREGLSETMRQYLAGQLHCLPHILPFFAPTINSYKRLVEGAWAPTTPTWGIDNRTVAIRALPGSARSARLETRVVGADVNPYLAMAGCLASGLYGIANKLELNQHPVSGNGYRDTSNGSLPRDLNEATQAMKNSELAQELFGAEFIEHFTSTREWEWKQYARSVSDWELKRYFEII